MSDDKPAEAPKPANEAGPTPYVVGPGDPHVERSIAPSPAPATQPAKGKHWVATAGDTYLNVGNLHVGPGGLEVGPKQLNDIRDAAAAAGITVHVHGEEN